MPLRRRIPLRYGVKEGRGVKPPGGGVPSSLFRATRESQPGIYCRTRACNIQKRARYRRNIFHGRGARAKLRETTATIAPRRQSQRGSARKAAQIESPECTRRSLSAFTYREISSVRDAQFSPVRLPRRARSTIDPSVTRIEIKFARL